MDQDKNNQEKQDKETNIGRDNEDVLPLVDDDDDLDDEVRSCLLGVPGFKSNLNSLSGLCYTRFYKFLNSKQFWASSLAELCPAQPQLLFLTLTLNHVSD